MGRGNNSTSSQASTMVLSTGRTSKRDKRKAYEEFKQEVINLYYLDTDEQVRQAAKALKALDPAILSLDIETASSAGKWGAENGSIRLIQLAVDEPNRGIKPTQFVIDCHKANPVPILQFLRTPKIEKQIHHLRYEQEWFAAHYDVEIGNIYDTCIAWRAIGKHIKDGFVTEDEVREAIPEYVRHDNKLVTLVNQYLGLEIPKEDQASDWSRAELTPDQIVYAAMDVATLPPLVRATKEVASAFGLEEDIDERILRAKLGVFKTVENKRMDDNDDIAQVVASVKRAKTEKELQEIKRLARQTSISAANIEIMREAIAKRRDALRSTSSS